MLAMSNPPAANWRLRLVHYRQRKRCRVDETPTFWTVLWVDCYADKTSGSKYSVVRELQFWSLAFNPSFTICVPSFRIFHIFLFAAAWRDRWRSVLVRKTGKCRGANDQSTALSLLRRRTSINIQGLGEARVSMLIFTWNTRLTFGAKKTRVCARQIKRQHFEHAYLLNALFSPLHISGYCFAIDGLWFLWSDSEKKTRRLKNKRPSECTQKETKMWNIISCTCVYFVFRRLSYSCTALYTALAETIPHLRHHCQIWCSRTVSPFKHYHSKT